MLSKTFCVISAPLVLLAQLARGVPVAPVAPFKGYSVVDIKWQLPIDPKDTTSKTVTVTGTIQEAIAKMEVTHPGWNETFASTLDFTKKPGTSLSTSAERDHYVCWPNDGTMPAHDYGILTGVAYLRALTTAAPSNNPKSCGRVSCTEDSGIWWCNNNPDHDKVITWGDIADSAEFVVNQCKDKSDMFSRSVKAWDFFKDEWSVAIHGDKC
ncbi:hypothetical protein B0T21DRAFT_406991 [Apiosordaria backusii]|uniref:Uncharacterized protein n=1 Tax=Apiosordaria backusii TaxID=314023 RepID=A0AA40EZN4_9PEZI|nr:hypothetical protein B0T21DRAFT_406991 [Apiosordaria backusii]